MHRVLHLSHNPRRPSTGDNTFDQTWHDSTYGPAPGGPLNSSMSVTFNGTAVYVYNILANVIPYTTTLTNLTFLVDGRLRGFFSHIPDPTLPAIMYRALVFFETGLSNEEHTLVMMTSDALQSSLVLFDYVIYTIELPTHVLSTSAKHISTTTNVRTTPPLGETTWTSTVVRCSITVVRVRPISNGDTYILSTGRTNLCLNWNQRIPASAHSHCRWYRWGTGRSHRRGSHSRAQTCPKRQNPTPTVHAAIWFPNPIQNGNEFVKRRLRTYTKGSKRSA